MGEIVMQHSIIHPGDSHWYSKQGVPMHTVIARGTGQPRPTTLADAKKLGLLPSVTSILRLLHKPELQNWIAKQIVMAVVTTPRHAGEELDAYLERVLNEERVHEQEAAQARDLGRDIHHAMDSLFHGNQIDDELVPWVSNAYAYLKDMLKDCSIKTEQVLVGSGFAGTADLIADNDRNTILIDFKSCKQLPEKRSWKEHRLQLAAYASALTDRDTIRTFNVYISTTVCGAFAVFENPDWCRDYLLGFAPLVTHWKWSSGFATIH